MLIATPSPTSTLSPTLASAYGLIQPRQTDYFGGSDADCYVWTDPSQATYSVDVVSMELTSSSPEFQQWPSVYEHSQRLLRRHPRSHRLQLGSDSLFLHLWNLISRLLLFASSHGDLCKLLFRIRRHVQVRR